MLNEEYVLCYAQVQDIDAWMRMIGIVTDNFPGLDSVNAIYEYRQIVLKNILRGTALCVKFGNEIVGVMMGK